MELVRFNTRLEFAADPAGETAGLLSGTAAVWGVENQNGVIFERGAFEGWLAGNRPAFLWQHDEREPIGVVTAASETDSGLAFSAQLNLGVARGQEAYALLQQGALTGVSMGVLPTESTPDESGAIRVSAGELWELSLVTFPAEPNARVTQLSSANPPAPPAPTMEVSAMTVDEILAALSAIMEQARADGDRELTPEESAKKRTLERELFAAQSKERRASAAEKPKLLATSAAAPQDERRAAFDRYVRTGAVTDGLIRSAQSEGVASAGGYLVPDEFAASIVERIVEFGGLANAATTLNTGTGNPLTIAVTIDDTANLGSIVSEGGAFASGADVVFANVSLGAYTYASNGTGTDPVKVSWELLDDSEFDLGPMLGGLLGTRIGRIQATHWITGDGAGEPLGVTTNKTPATQFGATITYAKLVDTIHALDPGYRGRASWLMSDATLSAIRQVVDSAGRPLWLPQSESGMGTMPGGSLLGFPVIIDQAMPDFAASGAAKSVGFGDWRAAYTIRRVRDIGIVRLNELYATTRQTGFFAWARADGTVVDSNAYTLTNNAT